MKTPEVHGNAGIAGQFTWLHVVLANNLPVFFRNINTFGDPGKITDLIQGTYPPVYSSVRGQGFQKIIPDDRIVRFCAIIDQEIC